MTAAVLNIFDDVDLGPSFPAQGRDGGSWKRPIWHDQGEAGTIVAVWKAEPGLYATPARALDETFVVLQGEAICVLGGAEPVTIAPGSIVHIPRGTPASLDVQTPFRKMSTVVPKPEARDR